MMKCYKIENDMLTEEGAQPFQNNTVCFCTPNELRGGIKVAPHTIDECTHPGPAKLEAYDGYDFILLNLIDCREQRVAKRIGIYVMPDKLIFTCAHSAKTVQDVLEALSSCRTANLSPERVLYAFFNYLTTKDSGKLEEFEEEISALEEQIMENKEGNYIKEIAAMRKKLMFFKKYYEQLLDIAESIEENTNELFSNSVLRYFRMFTARLERLNRSVLNLRDYITQVREAYQSQVDIDLNEIMKLFTVITAIFLPLTLLVGWYGMNFKNMPELQWQYGYAFAGGLSVLIVLISVLFFKKKKIL